VLVRENRGGLARLAAHKLQFFFYALGARRRRRRDSWGGAFGGRQYVILIYLCLCAAAVLLYSSKYCISMGICRVIFCWAPLPHRGGNARSKCTCAWRRTTTVIMRRQHSNYSKSAHTIRKASQGPDAAPPGSPVKHASDRVVRPIVAAGRHRHKGSQVQATRPAPHWRA